MAFDKKKYIQNYVKENYKRVALEYPKCWDEPVKERAKAMGKSKNEYIKYLILYIQFNIPTVAGSGLNEEMQLPEPQTSP